jgi:putative acyl-CoA dehydrogenase
MQARQTGGAANQPPPLEDHNRYLGNRALRAAVAREGAGWADGELAACGAELGSAAWIARGEDANRHPPRLVLFDRYGNRADRFEFHPAWHECLAWLRGHGLAGGTWGDSRPGAHVRRAALFQLFAEVECGSLCPATMSYGAAPLVARTPALAEPWRRLLAAPDYDARFIPAAAKRGVLIGMGMTERQGGSDVRANTTRAEFAGDGWYRLTGHKWFFSAPMCDAFFVTAQAPGGLSCFLLPRFTPDGAVNAIHLQRAKDKLGDHANASAEVEFHGALALLAGEEGRGIATVLEMANYTRLDCASGSAGVMRGALAEALHHARHRRVFGKPLVEQPLMANVLADMALEVAGHTALCLRVAATVDRQQGDEAEAVLKRLLTPLAKYWVCKRTPPLVAEAMEVIGGNGYVEEGRMARPFRQAPLNSIWEGSGNIMCLDLLRALGREARAREVLVAELERARGRNAGHDRRGGGASGRAFGALSAATDFAAILADAAP